MKIKWMSSLLVRFAVGTLAVAAVHANAAMVASFGPGDVTQNFNNSPNWTLGFEFQVTSPITIGGLGTYVQNGGGLSQADPVGLWTAGGSLLVSATVPAGTVAPLDGCFRVQPISAMTLQPGYYVVGAAVGGDNYTWNPNNFTMYPGTVFVSDAYVGAAGLNFPSASSGVTGWFGGNVQVVPEPATAIAGVAAGVLTLLSLRSRKSR